MKASLSASPSAPPRRDCSTSPTPPPTRRSARCCWRRRRGAWCGSACRARTPTSCWRTSRAGLPRVLEAPAELDEARRELDLYFEGKLDRFDLPLDWQLSEGFRLRVLHAIAAIPYGETRSYTEMATTAGNERAVRAAGTACGRNPIPLVVPCHRVLRSGGALGGYGGGLPMKQGLLRARGRARGSRVAKAFAAPVRCRGHENAAHDCRAGRGRPGDQIRLADLLPGNPDAGRDPGPGQVGAGAHRRRRRRPRNRNRLRPALRSRIRRRRRRRRIRSRRM